MTIISGSLPFTQTDLHRAVNSRNENEGRLYHRQGRVKDLAWRKGELSAKVQGSDYRPYLVAIDFEGEPGDAIIDGECTCPIGFNCKHVAAVLIAALATPGLFRVGPALVRHDAVPLPDPLAGPVGGWLKSLTDVAVPADSAKLDVALYVLDAGPTGPSVGIRAARPKPGGYGPDRQYPLENLTRRAAKLVRPEDVTVARLLSGYGGTARLADDPDVADLTLRRMIATGRCHWRRIDTPPLTLGPTQRARLVWELTPDGRQAVTVAPEEDGLIVLPGAALWYVDPQTSQAGPIDPGLPPEVAQVALRAPPLDRYQASAVRNALSVADGGKRTALAELPLPKDEVVEEHRHPKPVPVLSLMSIRVDSYQYYGYAGKWAYDPVVDLALLAFDYDGMLVEPTRSPGEIRRAEDDRVIVLHRDTKAERAARHALQERGLRDLGRQAFSGLTRDRVPLTFPWSEDTEELWTRFSYRDVPTLRAEGWRISIDPSFRYEVVDGSGDWEAAVEDGDGENGGGWWFSLDLGVDVDGERIQLLPVLVSLLQRARGTIEAGDGIDDLAVDGMIYAPLPDGRRIALPLERVRPLLATLVELFDAKALSPDGRLDISAMQAAGLASLEETMRLRWLGGERLKALAEKLASFEGLVRVPAPAGLAATLRPYQQEGLDWLQFLREHELGGILADDMGLGKTVQTLAHVLVEKEAGRLDRPSLVICPTSLVPNWRAEAERFAPSLKLVSLHGPDRAARFGELDDADLAVTTYPLLGRDEQALLERDWHLVVLDEAQAIKNPAAKATQVVSRLEARHRLCLTGTPVENHLGEVWSQFAFLMPGLLGDSRRFTRVFRTPIEKKGDTERSKLLSARLRPFILRRTKGQVAADLPPKTEMIRRVELAADQRDLYETLRLAMHKKVRDAVARKGMRRSHIEILDALLKLRQACCDPRLVKLPTARKAKSSAKLELLLSMVAEAVEEGRRVLLFSQFTSMLDLIAPRIDGLGIPYVELRGDTVDRATPVQRFQAGEVPLFLISLKAGGTGLNLTAADTVIHYDPWWNPAVENQATDRAHRIGQDKPVFVWKLIAQGTVEERILELQERKAALADALFDPDRTGKAAFDAEDLDLLFRPIE